MGLFADQPSYMYFGLLVIGVIFSLIGLIGGHNLWGRHYKIAAFIGIFGIIGVGMSAPRMINLINSPTRTDTLAQADKQPINVQFKDTDADSFLIEWETRSPVIGAIKYGFTPNSINQASAGIDAAQKKTNHAVQVNGLASGKTYYVQIISGGEVYFRNDPLKVTLP